MAKAGAGGMIALAEDGDRVEIDIPARSLELAVPEADLAARRQRVLDVLGGYRAADRDRPVSEALRVHRCGAGHQPPRYCSWLRDPRLWPVTAAVPPGPARVRPLTSAEI